MTAEGPSSIGAAFEEIVSQYGSRIAIRTPTEETTYEALNRSANRLSHTLVDRDLPGPVAILLGGGIAPIAALLAVYKSGLPALPLDAATPLPRVAGILRDAGAAALVTDTASGREAAQEAGIPSVAPGSGGTGADRNPAVRVASDVPALILYTSGSTGAPKGIVRSHGAILRNRASARRRWDPDARHLLVKSPAAGASIGAIYGPLLSGGTIFPYPFREGLPGLADWMAGQRITEYSSVPGLFRELARNLAGRPLPDLRSVRLGGDSVFWSDFELFRRSFPGTCVFQVSYACTETGSISAFEAGAAMPIGSGVMPVGTPCDDVDVRVVGPGGVEVGPGETGEIEVASDRLPDGYWRHPELTARVYRTDPVRAGWRIARTGDLGRLRPDGLLEHRGRIDLQVKVRGQRVDPLEIEAALRESPEVREAAVVSRGAGDRARLVAYVVPSPGRAPAFPAIRARLRASLPEAFVPDAFVSLAVLPLNPSGKPDRAALPEPVEETGGEASRPPSDALETALLEIWREILPARAGGVTDNFFDLGGHSLAAAEMLAAIERRFGTRLPLPVLIDAPTVETLAALVRSRDPARPESSLVALRAGGTRLPFFCVPGGNGPGFNFRTIARLLGEDQPFYAFHVATEIGEAVPATMAQWARRFLDEVVRIQPRGPYRLGGHSFGGHVAYEMGRLLHERGETVELVALLDTYAPGFPARGTPIAQGVGRWSSFLRRPFQAKVDAIRRRLRGARRRRGVGTAVAGYVPRPLAAPLVLFRATERDQRRGLSFQDPDNGWRAIAGEGLRTHAVPGNHDTMIEGSGAAEIARWLSIYLSEGNPAFSGTATASPRADTDGAPNREAS